MSAKQILEEYDRHIDAAASLALRYGIPATYGNKRMQQSYASCGNAANLKPADVGGRVGLGQTTIYNAANGELPAPKLESLLSENIVNVLLKEQRSMTAAELAEVIDEPEELIAEVLDSNSQFASDDEVGYRLQEGVNEIVHSYPSTTHALVQRRAHAALVGESIVDRKSFSLKVPMTAALAEECYRFIRDYENKLPSEEIFIGLQGESKRRKALPVESTYGGVLLFSPDRGEINAPQHYRTCDDLYCDPRYEMIPTRYPLDETAIGAFIETQYDKVIDEASELLGRYRSADQLGTIYRLSFIGARING